MERKIGEIFEYNGEWYQCLEEKCCNGCVFRDAKCDDARKILGNCSVRNRSDKKSVIFKKLEKVGEPYPNADKLYQLYKLPMNIEKLPPHTEGINLVRFDIVEIELKQTKKGMEEKKQCGDNRFRAIARAKEHLFQSTNIAEDKKELEVLDSFLLRCWQMGWLKQYEDAEEKKLNLKPFDIQKAREGKPVCTRDGRKARIICFDKKDNQCPIVALVDYYDRKDGEAVTTYTNEGFFCIDKKHPNDLMMLPEKKEGWVNIYKSDNGTYYTGAIFYEKNDALVNTAEIEITTGIPRDCIDTVKIEWEE